MDCRRQHMLQVWHIHREYNSEINFVTIWTQISPRKNFRHEDYFFTNFIYESVFWFFFNVCKWIFNNFCLEHHNHIEIKIDLVWNLNYLKYNQILFSAWLFLERSINFKCFVAIKWNSAKFNFDHIRGKKNMLNQWLSTKVNVLKNLSGSLHRFSQIALWVFSMSKANVEYLLHLSLIDYDLSVSYY